MTPTELRALRGRWLVPNVRTRSELTARYRVVGFGADTVRVQSSGGQRSSMPVADVAQAIERELLTVEDT